MFRQAASALLTLVLSAALFAAPSDPILQGTVRDGVGRALPGAQIALLKSDGTTATTATSGNEGAYSLSASPGTYTLRVTKESFATYTAPVTLTASQTQRGARGVAALGPALALDVTLDIAPVQQTLVVTATGVPTPQTQLGQSVSVADQSDIAARRALTADETLRQLPGVQVYRNGAVGGLTSVMLRGGDPSFTKIMVDGVPVQRFDFGAFDFSTLSPESLDSITVVRGADSVVYGTDAAAGVIDIRTRGGEGVGAPQLTLATMAGTYDTGQTSAELLGSWQRFSYGLTFGYLDTDNQLPNNKAWNQSWNGNFGLDLPVRTHLDLDLHRTASRAGDPNAFLFFGLPDDSWQRQGETYASLSVRQQTTQRWTNHLTLAQSDVNYYFNTFSPSGTPFDPFGFGANYLGNTVTIRGANGYSVTGQGILDFAGTYPAPFNSDTVGRYLTAESDYAIAPGFTAVAGYRYSDETGVIAPTDAWHANGGFFELSGGMWNRLFGSAGASDDANSRFGNTFNPQASLALLPRLNRAGWWDEVRLHANAATAQKDPNIVQDQSSLYQVVANANSGARGAAALGPAPTSGPAASAQLGLTPIHPQRAHTFDLGADQYLFGDQLRASATWFDDRYDDLIEFVPSFGLAQLGVSNAAVSAAQAAGGAYLNSLSESSKGMELELLTERHGGWHGSVTYTYLIPVVTRSFSSDALSPAINPAFPNIPIGAFSPLVGGRPFHVAPESGTVVAGYEHRAWQAQANLYVASRRDDSTFLTDGFFGDSMLLPNHDLAPAYAALNLSGSYRWNQRVTWDGVIDNLLNHDYQESFGFPSLGRAIRVGVRLTLTPPKK